MESWSSRVPSSSGVNVVGSLSDIYLILDVSSCSVKGFGVFYLPQDMAYIVSDFAEFARRVSRRTCAAHIQNRNSKTALLLFYQCDLLVRQAVQFVHQYIYTAFQVRHVRSLAAR